MIVQKILKVMEKMRNYKDKIVWFGLILLTVALILTLCVSAWIITYAIFYFVSLCFKFEFNWIMVTAAWLIIILLNLVFIAITNLKTRR